MAKGILNGSAVNTRIPKGATALTIGSVDFPDGVATPTGDSFTVNAIGDYTLEVLLRVAGVMGDINFRLEVFNLTTGSMVASIDKVAPGSGTFALCEQIFSFSVTDVTHRFQVRIVTLDTFGGEPTNTINLDQTGFRGELVQFTGTAMAAGTINTVSKFTAPSTLGDSNITDDGTIVTIGSDAVVTGDLQVQGAVMSIETQTVLVEDNHIYMNAGYTTAVAQTAGLAVNYLPTAVVDTVAVGGFTAGVGGVSDPTVATTGAATFAGGDLVQISGATDPANNGLFEVQAHAGNVMTLRGVGLNPTVEDFTQTQLVTDATVAGAITQVNVSVMRSGVDGVWESARGSVTGFAFVDVIDGVGTINTVPKFTAAGTLGDSRITDDATTIDFIVALKLRSVAAPAAFANGAGAGIDFYWRTEDALAASAARGGDLILTVGAGDGAGRDGTFSVPGVGAGSEKFGLASVAGGANAVAVGNAAVANGAQATVVGAASGTLMTGADNTVIGQACAPTLVGGTANVVIGHVANVAAAATANAVCIGDSAVVAASGVTIGHGAAPLITGANNVVVGETAAALMVGSTNTTIIGRAAAPVLTAGTGNVIMGSGSGTVLATGNFNVLIGSSVAAAAVDTTSAVGIGNAAHVAQLGVTIGQGAAPLVTGSSVVTIGNSAASTLVTGTNNVVIGQSADVAVAATASAVVVGQSSQVAVNGVTVGQGSAANVTGTDNTVVGQGSALLLSSGARNTILGEACAVALSTNNDNVIIGQGTAFQLNSAFNVVVGQGAASTSTNGSSLVIIGESADAGTAAASNAVGIGQGCKVSENGVTVGQGAALLVTGTGNTVVGQASAPTLTTGTSNVLMGQGADVAATATADSVGIGQGCQVGSTGVTIGQNAAPLVTGSNNVIIGHDAAGSIVGAIDHVIIGQFAAANVATGDGNVLIGRLVAGTLSTGSFNTLLGQSADVGTSTDASAVAIGNSAQAGTSGVSIGSNASANVTGLDNTVVGQLAAATLTTGTANVVIGQSADVAVAGTASAVVVGASASQAAVNGVTIGDGAALLVTGTDNTVVGQGAATTLAAGTASVVVGQGSALLMTGSENTILGQASAPTLVAGTSNVVIGQSADVAVAATADAVGIGANCQVADDGVTIGEDAAPIVTGIGNSVIGQNAARILAAGYYNVIIGADTGSTLTTGDSNVCIGGDTTAADTARAVGIGFNSGVAVNGVTIGEEAALDATGTDNTVMGQNAAATLRTGTDNVCIGHVSDLGAAVTNCVVVGDSATSTFNTCVVLGSASVSTAINQFVCGGNNLAITDIYFGEGVVNATPPNITFHGTGGTGSNIIGGDLTVAGGISTGSAIGGEVVIRATDIGAAAATPNTLQWVAAGIPDEGTITALAATESSRGWLHREAVESRTSSYSLSALESGKRFTNKSAGGAVTLTLPAASPGLIYTFIVDVAQNLIIDCTGTDQIRVAANISTATTGDVRVNTIGYVITIMAIKDTSEAAAEWYAISMVGTWNVN